MTNLDLGQAYEQHAPRIRRYLLNRTHDEHVADELLSQVFESALRLSARYEDRGYSVSAWLYTIAHSRLMDYYRRERRRAHFVAIEDCVLCDDGGIDAVAHQVDRAPLRAALPQLAPRYQALIGLRFFEGRTIAETAAALHLTTGGVKALQYRAIAALRARVCTQL